MSASGKRPLVLFVCSEVGVFPRGIGSFFREAFDALNDLEGLDIRLLKGGGEAKANEVRMRLLRKTSPLAKWLGRLIRRDEYVVELHTALPFVVHYIRTHRPDAVFCSDMPLLRRLDQLRKYLNCPVRLIFSNGLPARGPYTGYDHVHQVVPFYYDQDLAAGETPERMTMVPYGIRVPAGHPGDTLATREGIRSGLGLPPDRPIVLSVGWISSFHKRMDYVIEEFAGALKATPSSAPRPFLMLLGAIDSASGPIIELAARRLDAADYAIRSVPYEQVANYYRSADLFTLASLTEGFGRVYLEALMHGLPAIVHDNPITRFVLGDQGTFGDLSKPGELTRLLAVHLRSLTPSDLDSMARRRESVRERFDWSVLREDYRRMFLRALEGRCS